MKRGRKTRRLIELAWDRFKGCEQCWHDDACVSPEELLKPLRLRQLERDRLAKSLVCPNCESKIDYYFGNVVPYETHELRDRRKIELYAKRYASDFQRFHKFLLKHPGLSALHPTGRELAKFVSKARTITLEPKVWYRARGYNGEQALDPAEFFPADPKKHYLAAGRFNYAGQLGYYVAEKRETAAIEKLGNRTNRKSVWIAAVRLLKNLRVLDLRVHILGYAPSLPLVLHGLVYEGIISAANEEDKSHPEYRVTQFIADLVRWRGVDGVLYTRTRDAGFLNREAWGTNLVVFAIDPGYVEIAEEPGLYRFDEVRSIFLFSTLELTRVPVEYRLRSEVG